MSNAIPSPIVTDAQNLAQHGDVARAFELLSGAVRGGDADAAVALADWRLSGGIIRRDLAEACALYGRAALLGRDDVAPTHIAMLANMATGKARNWGEAISLLRGRAAFDPLAARQLQLIEAMTLDDKGDPVSRADAERISANPQLDYFAGFLSAAETDYLINMAKPLLQPSMVVHPTTGRMIHDPIRRAQSAIFPFVREDPVIHAINRRIAVATGTSAEQGEPLQVLCYTVGQEYKVHSDALPSVHNQRTATFLATLNENFDGGATYFPAIDCRVRGCVGDALHFVNVDQNGAANAAARHSGEPVTHGVKFIMSKWIRERPLDLTGPPGRPF